MYHFFPNSSTSKIFFFEVIFLLNWIWAALIGISVVCGAVIGRMPEVASAAISGASEAIELLLSIAGMILLWNGLMEVGEKAGLVRIFSKAISPLLKFLFPDAHHDKKAMDAVSMNMAANFLGLGNAATPLGIRAVGELKRLGGGRTEATKSMSMFILINTASIQFLPTTVAALRAAQGSKSPFEILPAVWLTSLLALGVGVFAVKLFERLFGRCRRSKQYHPM